MHRTKASPVQGEVARQSRDGGIDNPPVSYADSPLCTRGPRVLPRQLDKFQFVEQMKTAADLMVGGCRLFG